MSVLPNQMITIITCIANNNHYHYDLRFNAGVITMKLRFLCGAHREELTKSSGRAITCWQDGFDTGQMFYEQQMWQEALPHLGCAFETSEIMITTKALEASNAYELFTSSASLLMGAFGKLGYVEPCQNIYSITVDRLKREIANNPAAEVFITKNLNALYRQIQELDILADQQNSLSSFAYPHTFAAVH